MDSKEDSMQKILSPPPLQFNLENGSGVDVKGNLGPLCTE